MNEVTSVVSERGQVEVEVEFEFERLLAARAHQAASYGPLFVELWDTAAECMQGGKMLRPRLCLGAYDALISDDRPGAVPRPTVTRIAAAIELLHYSFLLHDDVIDGDLVRRGRPNLIGSLFQARRSASPRTESNPLDPEASTALHWARTSGILMGDLLLTAAFQAFAREPLPVEVRLRLLDLLDHAVTESVVGEHLDVSLSDRVMPADLATVLSMSRLKTATYTFELPMRAAVILAGLPVEVEALVGTVGRHLGTAFQLQDDALSTFGSAPQHGKDPFSDLREGKETAIIAFARTTSAWPRIAPYVGLQRLGVDQGHLARRLLVECGAEAFVRSLIEEQIRASFAFLSDSENLVTAGLTRFFEDLVASMEGRSS